MDNASSHKKPQQEDAQQSGGDPLHHPAERKCPACGLIVPLDTRIGPNDSAVSSHDSVPNYRFIRLIGSGGMGQVYEAEHIVLKNRVAIKLLRAHLDDKDAIMRFQQEAKTTSKLKHSNIVSVFDCGVSEEGQPYMIMDLVAGEPLDMVLKRGALPVAESLNIFRQLCQGVMCAHENGILHRDLKPSNIMLERSNRGDANQRFTARVLDFGIAKIIESDEALMRTRTGEIFGTPTYMSPEQAEARKLDQRSDIYSLTCVLYEMLTGSPPFIGKSPVDLLYKHCHEKPLSLSEATMGKEFPEWLERLVAKGLAKDPAHRFLTLADMIDAIDSSSIDDQSAISAKPEAKRLWIPVVLATIVATLVVATVVDRLLAPNSRTAPVVSAFIAPPAKSDSPTHTTAAEEQNRDDEAFAQMLNRSDKHMTELSDVPAGIHDNSLGRLAQFPDLETIELSECTNITGYGLYKLRKVKRLKTLILKGIRCGDAIDILNMMPRLNALEISYTNLSTHDFWELQGSSIESLNIGHTAITNEAFRDISRFKQLTRLKLDGCKIGDDAVNSLAALKNLQILSLNETKVSDGIIDFLVNTKSKLTRLSACDIRNSSFNNGLLEAIVKRGAVPNLTFLDLSGDKQFSAAEIAAFKASRPHCEVKHDELDSRTVNNEVEKEAQR